MAPAVPMAQAHEETYTVVQWHHGGVHIGGKRVVRYQMKVDLHLPSKSVPGRVQDSCTPDEDAEEGEISSQDEEDQASGSADIKTKFLFPPGELPFLLHMIYLSMSIEEKVSGPRSTQDTFYQDLAPDSSYTFPFHDYLKDMILDQWREPSKKAFTSRGLKRRYPFSEDNSHLWEKCPKLDAPFAKISKGAGLAFEDFGVLNDPLDKKMESLLKKDWQGEYLFGSDLNKVLDFTEDRNKGFPVSSRPSFDRWIINLDKSSLVPSQVMTYLGFEINSIRQVIILPHHKVTVLQNAVRMLCSEEIPSVLSDRVVLKVDPCYLPKVASDFHRTQEIIIPSISEDEPQLIPLDVRSLLLRYLQETKDFRKDDSASQDEAMFVHAQSYEDLTGEVEDPVPQSPGLDGGDEVSSMEQISEDFSKLSTQLSVSSGAGAEQSQEEAADQEQVDATEEANGDCRTQDDWYRHQKHIFVLSEAGKPVYSRYRSEEALSSTAGIMMALVSFLESDRNAIRSIHADGYKVVFVRRSPLVLVSVSHTQQSEQEIAQQLLYIYYQIVSLVTGTQLHHLFQQRPSYDLRQLLAGSEQITDRLLDSMDSDPSFLLGAVSCLAMTASLRDATTSCLQQAKAKSLVFSILMCRSQLVTLVRKRDQYLHPIDLHLLFNLVTSSSSFREGEAWTPVCLPKFNPSGFFHAHISYLSHQPELCLLMVSTDREDFFTASDCKRKIMERLEKRGTWGLLKEALANSSYNVTQIGIPELWHFLYKSKSSGLFTSPVLAAPYDSARERKRLVALYQYLHGRAHCSARPLTTIYHTGARENVLAWVTEAFELYVCFSPLGTKSSAVSGVSRLLRWIRKEEERLFILSSPTY
ncbi:vacuolar fusion protein MON1 homolog A [Gastrophryne carolinensis]